MAGKMVEMNYRLANQEITHTINIELDLPVGSEFETFALYGLSKSQFDAIKRPNALSLPLLKFAISAIAGLILPDISNLYKNGSFDLSPIADRISFVVWILVLMSICEVLRITFCHLIPITERQKTWKEISKHFGKYKSKKVRSK